MGSQCYEVNLPALLYYLDETTKQQVCSGIKIKVTGDSGLTVQWLYSLLFLFQEAGLILPRSDLVLRVLNVLGELKEGHL